MFTKPVMEVGEEEFDRLFAVNVKGAFFAQAGNRSCSSGRCSSCFRATINTARSRSSLVTYAGRRVTASAALPPSVSRALTATTPIGPTLLTLCSRASPLDKA
jgi:hypothetical protein